MDTDTEMIMDMDMDMDMDLVGFDGRQRAGQETDGQGLRSRSNRIGSYLFKYQTTTYST